MKIEWCDKHNAPVEADGVFCMGEGYGRCRFVPMRLIPDNALEREWRCWREDGSYYGPCPPIDEPWEHEVWREDRHGDCGWQFYVMEAALDGETP